MAVAYWESYVDSYFVLHSDVLEWEVDFAVFQTDNYNDDEHYGAHRAVDKYAGGKKICAANF